MLESVIAVVLAIVFWNLREAFYGKSKVFKETIDITVKTSEVELQDDFSDLIDLINEKKTDQNGKWFSMKDVDKLMTHSDPKTK